MHGTLEVNIDNILPIIKSRLYSEKDIFVRELISNASDALAKFRKLTDRGVVLATENPLQIHVTTDKEAKTITIEDNGIGMTHEEVKRYIAQIACSGAAQFLQESDSNPENNPIIGHFGVGFYSAYMVAQKVTLESRSYQANAEAVLWSCSGTSSYECSTSDRSSRGTKITLFLEQEAYEFLDPERLRAILVKYCGFLCFPIFLNQEQINVDKALWLSSPSHCSENDYLSFYRILYPQEPAPSFWIHLQVDYPFELKGILYFPKVTKNFDWGQRAIKLFSNRVFVSENGSQLLPEYFSLLRGVLESPAILLNVSRSILQMDDTIKQLSKHIVKKVIEQLLWLREHEPAQFSTIWVDLEMPIKLGCLQDSSLYDQVKALLVWRNQQGAWTTIDEYIQKHCASYKKKVFYVLAEKKESCPAMALFKEQNIEVLETHSVIDPMLFTACEARWGVECVRVDGEIGSLLLDPAKEKTVLNQDGTTKKSSLEQLLNRLLHPSDLQIEAKSLASQTVPAILVLNEQDRRYHDALALTQQETKVTTNKTWVVNTNHPLIDSLDQLESDPLQEMIAKQLYDLTLLAQREFSSLDLMSFVQRDLELLAALSEHRRHALAQEKEKTHEQCCGLHEAKPTRCCGRRHSANDASSSHPS